MEKLYRKMHCLVEKENRSNALPAVAKETGKAECETCLLAKLNVMPRMRLQVFRKVKQQTLVNAHFLDSGAQRLHRLNSTSNDLALN